MNTDELLFYDIECFKHDSLVVFKNWSGEVWKFWNDPNRAERISCLIADKILVGYNNHYYDDRMLFYITRGNDNQALLKAINDTLIAGNFNETLNVPWLTLDAMQQIDVSMPSLKQIEGNMGISIEETEVDFNLDRHLTEDEKRLTEFYCEHDVDATIEVFKKRIGNYFETKEYIAKMLFEESKALPLKTILGWNTTSIVGRLLLSRYHQRWLKLGNGLDCWKAVWRKIPEIPPDVWDLWETAETVDCPEGKAIEKQIFGCTFSFGFGGLHGVGSKKHYQKVKLLDVASMYPSIMINMEALGDSTEKYRQIKEERLKAKRAGDKLRSDALKLILNSTYGLLKNQYSPLYNPKASSSVCIYGQIAAFCLAKRLYEAGYELVNINTDGVGFGFSEFRIGFSGMDKFRYMGIWNEWEKDFGLTLELDDFDSWSQKDVNNYVATSKGKIKTKGGEVGKFEKEKLFSNNSCRIVNIVLTEKLLNPDEDVFRLLKKHRDEMFNPTEWMYILKAGRTYKGVWDKISGNQQQKVNRVFAVKEQYADVDLYKRRLDDGVVKFPDAPQHMKLWNRDCSEISKEAFRKQIDLEHYRKIVEKKLKEWK